VIFFSSAKEILSKNSPGIVVPDQFFARFANSALKRGKFDLLVFPGVSCEPVAPGGVRLAAARPHSHGPQNMAFQTPDSTPMQFKEIT